MPANKTIWILGDALLREAAGHYQALKKELKSERGNNGLDNRIHIDKNYAVKIASPGMYMGNNVLAIILDSLVDMLNANPKIPHTMIIVLNDKKFWNDKDLLSKQMDRLLTKFLKELHKILDLRKYALDEKAVDWDCPRLFLTRPLPLPNNLAKESYPTGFRSNRRKFNKILDKSTKQGNYSIINLAGFTSQNKEKLFDLNGKISEKGLRQFWIEISSAIQLDDETQRIAANKLKAKKMAMTIQAELLDENDSDLSDTEKVSDKGDDENISKHQPEKRQCKLPSRRQLSKQFDSPRRRMEPGKSASPSQTETKRSHQVHHHHMPRAPGYFKPRRRYHQFNPFYPQHYPSFPQPRFFHY